MVVSPRLKLWVWLGAWAATAGVVMASDPARLLMAPCFPIGLRALLPNGDQKAIIGWMQVYPWILGWGVYLGLSSWLFRTRSWPSFLCAYTALCAVLALNVSGCSKMLEAVAGIH